MTSLPIKMLVTASLIAISVLAPSVESSEPLPEFTRQSPAAWINSRPLRISDLRGQVALIDVWTFACWNCYRSFPWLRSVEKRFGPSGLRVVGIHSPELERERDPKAVVAKVRKYGLLHPVMIDNDFAYWKALGNRAWPAFYLVDRQGNIRARFVGETHAGDAQARRIESEIEVLLEE